MKKQLAQQGGSLHPFSVPQLPALSTRITHLEFGADFGEFSCVVAHTECRRSLESAYAIRYPSHVCHESMWGQIKSTIPRNEIITNLTYLVAPPTFSLVDCCTASQAGL